MTRAGTSDLGGGGGGGGEGGGGGGGLLARLGAPTNVARSQGLMVLFFCRYQPSQLGLCILPRRPCGYDEL